MDGSRLQKQIKPDKDDNVDVDVDSKNSKNYDKLIQNC